MNLLTTIRSLFEPVLAELAPDKSKLPDLLNSIKPATNSDHGDYQANAAMSLGNALKQKPHDIAKTIIARLPANDILEEPTIAGPGFINLRVKAAFLAKAVQSIATDPKLGVEEASKPQT